MRKGKARRWAKRETSRLDKLIKQTSQNPFTPDEELHAFLTVMLQRINNPR